MEIQKFNDFIALKENTLGKSLEDFLTFYPFPNNTVVVFDVESTGLQPRLPHVQITELSAIPINLLTGEFSDPFVRNIKLNQATIDQMQKEKLNPPSSNRRIMSIEKVLSFQSYNPDTSHHDEIKACVEFSEYINSIQNPILVAHNATFDMSMINGLLRRERLPKIKAPVIDTFKFVKLYFEPIIKQLASKGHVKAGEILSKLKDEKGFVRTTLPKLGQALNISTLGSHQAINDVMQTGHVFKEIIKFILENKDEIHDEKTKSSFEDAKKNWLKFKKKVNIERRK